jgi:amino acid permease
LAIYGWLRFFAHSQYWFEWIVIVFLVLFYVLTAVVVAQQDGQRQGT